MQSSQSASNEENRNYFRFSNWQLVVNVLEKLEEKKGEDKISQSS
jgi:hypothetical protein